MPSDVVLVVGGRRYRGWKSMSVTRSIESMSGSFALDVSDRWGEFDEPWPIAEEDHCQLLIQDTPVITGYVDRRDPRLSETERTLSYAGRDRCAALVDCSIVLDRWTFRDVTLLELATAIAGQFGVTVTVDDGIDLPRHAKVAINPGDRGYETLQRVASDDGVLLTSSGLGDIVLTRTGSARAAPLTQGINVRSASAQYTGEARYHRYVIATQAAATDQAFGEATRVRAEARDEEVRRTDRVLLMRPEKGYSVEDARRRADWEARTRAASSERVTVEVQGWTQPDGQIWPVNAITRVTIPGIGVAGDMLITEVQYTMAERQSTTIQLARPDAYTPEPKATVRRSSGGLWKELDRGGL